MSLDALAVIPFGVEWKADVMKMTKEQIIDNLLKPALIERSESIEISLTPLYKTCDYIVDQLDSVEKEIERIEGKGWVLEARSTKTGKYPGDKPLCTLTFRSNKINPTIG